MQRPNTKTRWTQGKRPERESARKQLAERGWKVHDFNPTDILQYHRFLVAETRERVDRFQRAIDVTVRPGDIVLDLGAGTGILSLLACRAGASQVVAVEDSPVAELAEALMAANGVRERVTIVNDSSVRVVVEERADVLVTDTFGIFGFERGGLTSILDARRRLLTPQARLIPRALELWVALVEQPDFFHRAIDVWAASVQGINLSAIRPFAVNNHYPIRIDDSSCVTNPVRLARIDLAEFAAPTIKGLASVEARRDGLVHGICGWFEAELADGVVVDNAPGGTTNYAQTFLPIDTPRHVKKGERARIAIQNYDMVELAWRIEIGDAGARAATASAAWDHSTFWGFPLSKERLRRLWNR